MRSRTLLIVALCLVVTGVLGLAAISWLTGGCCGSPQAGRTGGGPGSTDAMFIEQMVPHHQDAIDMSELALTRAERPEIRDLARRIIESQSAENEQMRGWYEEWFGGSVPEGSGMGGMMGSRTDLDRLRTAEDFDREFIEQMVPHHQMAIMMARMAGRWTKQPEMRRLTASIVRTQSQEIRDMLRWYRQWYGG